MRISLILLLLISFKLTASEDAEMKRLFEQYDQIMKHHQVELVDEVFTKKFLEDSGGKEEFITKVKELPKAKKERKIRTMLRSWKKGKIGEMFFAKVKDDEEPSKTKDSGHESQFIVVREEGKLKIDGTISDPE
jgi:hypothetical protein